MTDQRVLVVVAHPDDEVLGMGGTMAKHALCENTEVAVLCLTDGSSSQYPGDQEILDRKYREARAAAKILGASQYLQRDFPDMKLDGVPHVEVNRAVEDVVDAFGPDTVYTVHPDVNLDHRATFRSVMVATRPRSGSPVRQVLSYAPMSSIEWTSPFEATFTPNWFSNISRTINEKVAAFDCYTTENRPWPHPRSSRAIKATAQHWGASVGWDYAEPFVLIRRLRE